MKQKQFFLFLVLTLLLLSLLNWLESQWIWMWKLSVVTLEYGHFFAILCFGLILLKFLKREPTAIFASIFLLIAAAGFLKPLYQLSQDSAYFSILNPKMLFMGRSFEPIVPDKLVYKEVDGEALVMDYYPAINDSNGAWVLVVHGGGWDAGDREQLPELNSLLANQGYAIFSIDYRLTPKYLWPAQKEDTISAIQFIQNNSDNFKIDKTKWAILGRSAGGQIAAATALVLPDDLRPKALLIFYAPTEMTFAYEVASPGDLLESRTLITNLLGGSPYSGAQANYSDASPLHWISEKTPPTLLLYGKSDVLVWHKHGERLYERLRFLDVHTDFIKLPWATHGFDFNLNGPGGQISTYMIQKYLSEFVLSP
jgi:acetyl esterase/lipase